MPGARRRRVSLRQYGEPEERPRPGAISVNDALRTSLARNTRRAYHYGWRRFTDWCAQNRVDPMAATPEAVARFVVAAANPPRSPESSEDDPEADRPLAPGTIRISLAAINWVYGERSLKSPARDRTVTRVLRGIARLAQSQPRQVKALREQQVAAMLDHCDQLATRKTHRAIAVRDAAVITVGFAAALRRSEISRLRLDDLEFVERAGVSGGMFLHIRQSKTDQLARGQSVAIPEGRFIRPVERLRRWLDVGDVTHGPVFQALWRGGRLRGTPLHPTDIAHLLKRHVVAIGLDASEYSGHSLRAGFATSAAAHSARLDKIMEVTRHASADSVLDYIRRANAFEDHAGAAFL